MATSFLGSHIEYMSAIDIIPVKSILDLPLDAKTEVDYMKVDIGTIFTIVKLIDNNGPKIFASMTKSFLFYKWLSQT